MNLQQTIAEASQLYEAGQLPQSEALCRNILQHQSGFPPAYFQLALIAVKVGKLELASDLVLQAVNLAPSDFAYRRTLCEIYRRLQRYDDAVKQGRQAVMLAPK